MKNNVVGASHGVARSRVGRSAASMLRRWLVALGLGLVVSFELGGFAFAADKARVPDALPGATLVDAKWVKSALDGQQKLLIIDARIPSEYAEGHLPGAVNLDERRGVTLAAALPKDTSYPVLFYCNGPKCVKSYDSAKQSISLGYTHVYWFRGGIPEWTSHGYPLE